MHSNNLEATEAILGGPTELAPSGNEAQDRIDHERFVQNAMMLGWAAMPTSRPVSLTIIDGLVVDRVISIRGRLISYRHCFTVG